MAPNGKRKISTEKRCLILGCSPTRAQRLRLTLKQMAKEEVKELIGKATGDQIVFEVPSPEFYLVLDRKPLKCGKWNRLVFL